MKRKIGVIVFFILVLSSANCVGKKNTSNNTQPTETSGTTKQAQKKAEQAQKKADEAKKHAEKAKNATSESKAKSEAKKAEQSAKEAAAANAEAAKYAAQAKAEKYKTGILGATYNAEAERARLDAEKAQYEAYKAKQEADEAAAAFRKSKEEEDRAVEDSETADSEYEEALRLLEEAKKADEEFQKAYEAYKQKHKEYDKTLEEFQKLYSGDNKNKVTNKELESMKKDLERKAEDLKKYKDMANYYADKMKDAYEKLGEYKNEFAVTGDPVEIATGSFVVEYDDYIAQDFNIPFSIKRYISEDNKCDSFGINWKSSLDSRIIRCNFESYEEYKKLLEQMQNLITEMKSIFIKYSEENPKYPRPEGIKFLFELNEMKEENDQDLLEINEIENIRKELIELNKYVTYGRYSDPESYYGYKQQLKYLDVDGREYDFCYESNGFWKCLGKMSSSKMKLFGLKEDGSKSSDDDTSGGYLIEYTDGHKRQFNKYGVLINEVDLNDNKITYENTNGQINKIILKTGESLSIERNQDNLITKITGDVSGTAYFVYQNNQLIGFTDNSGLSIKYDYDNNNNLVKITKADGNCVCLEYSFNSILNKNICTKVTNENGSSEFFNLDVENKSMQHITYDGKSEIYKFNEFNNPIYVKDKNSNITIFNPNEDQLITYVSSNNVSKTISYDEYFRPVKIYLDNGGVNSYEYNQYGQITKIIDADGFVREYLFNEKGNLISDFYCGKLVAEYSYYQNGLLKTIKKNGTKSEFTYNAYGSVIEKKVTLKDNNYYTISAEYNNQNQITKYIDKMGNITYFSYSKGKITEITDTKKTERFYDLRNREYLIIETDIKSGIFHSKEYEFDGTGNIVKIFIDKKLYREYNYSEDGILLGEIKWAIDEIENNLSNNINYYYNDRGYLEKQIEDYDNRKYITKNNIFSFNNDITVVKKQNENHSFTTYEMDKYEHIVKEQHPDGYTINYSYSKAGRIQSKKDSNNNLWKYYYNTDGSYQIELETLTGIKLIWIYDLNKQLTYYKDFAGNEVFYKYDEHGNIVNEKNKFYEMQYKYDLHNRRIFSNVIDNQGHTYYEYKINYDDKKNTADIIRGNAIYMHCKFDCFGNIVEATGINGKHYYSYNGLGCCIADKDSNDNIIQYYYDFDNLLCKIINPDGTNEIYKYNSFGKKDSIFVNNKQYYSYEDFIDDKTIIVKDCFGTQNKFVYNDEGIIIESENSKTGNFKIDYRNETDVYGNLIKEVFTDKTLDYSYDLEGQLVTASKNGNLVLQNKYSENRLESLYSDGMKTEIIKNAIGLITKIKNDNSILEYEYDSYGKMVSSYDSISDIKVEYYYDNYGRCVEKKSTNFDLLYEYNDCGYIEKIIEKRSGTWVSFSYDSLCREIKRCFWNGCSTRTNYDTQGFIESRISENEYDQIVSADFIIRDENGRISVVCNESGNYEKYIYDNKGHLVTSIIPFNKAVSDFYFNEYIECGLPYSNENCKTKNTNLSSKEIALLNNVISNSKISTLLYPVEVQESWVDEYEYTDNGAVSSIKNNLSKIVYEYDEQNRLQKKYIENFSDNKMLFNWNDDGELITIEGKEQSVTIDYNGMKKTNQIKVKHYSTSSESNIKYSYDALGRRVNEINDNQSFVYIYDGISSTVIGKYVTKNDFTVNDFYYSNEIKDPKDYRWIDDSSYVPYGSVKTVTKNKIINTDEKNKKDNRAYFVMGLNKEPLAYIYLDGGNVSGVNANSLMLNYKENCVAVCDENSNCIAKNYYDIWGNPILQNMNPIYNFSTGYFDSVFSLYNLGSRDYSPIIKSYTTQDTARDGNNWYSFCCTDPVNYFDFNGKTIIPTGEFHLMTDVMINYEEKEVKIDEDKTEMKTFPIYLGNQTEYQLKDHGCYVISFVNVINEMINRGYKIKEEKYRDPLEVNDNDKFFAKDSDSMIISNLLNETVGSNNYEDYSDLQDNPKFVEALLAKAQNSPDDYFITAVFDLSEVEEAAPNHMVVIDGEAGEDGVFDPDDITGSSSGDNSRLSSYKKSGYNIDNIKRLFLIKAEKKDGDCSK